MKHEETIFYVLEILFSLWMLVSIYFDAKHKRFYITCFLLVLLMGSSLYFSKETGIINKENAIYWMIGIGAVAFPLVFACGAEIGARLAGKKD